MEVDAVRANSLESSDQLDYICKSLALDDYIHLRGDFMDALMHTMAADFGTHWRAFASSWGNLPLDEHMADGGTYRRRRHATLSADPGGKYWTVEGHQPHYQSSYYNRLNGGIARYFAPIESQIVSSTVFSTMMNFMTQICGRLAPYSRWHIEAHQFRITVQDSNNPSPTPEGMHRDGVDYAFMSLIQRQNLNGGVTSLYREGALDYPVIEFELSNPLETAIVNDERLRHGVSSIQARDPGTSSLRDALVVTFRHKPRN